MTPRPTRNTTTRDRHRTTLARGKPPCALCGEPINYELAWPDLRCYVVDHIEPLGPNPTPERIAQLDILENKQPAHNDCNRRKWHYTATPETRRTFTTWRTW